MARLPAPTGLPLGPGLARAPQAQANGVDGPAYAQWQGRPGYGVRGEFLGFVLNVFADDVTGQPTWATVRLGGGANAFVFVPMAGASAAGSVPTFAVERAAVNQAPRVGRDDHISREEESVLRHHYRLGSGDAVVDVPVRAQATIALVTEPAGREAPVQVRSGPEPADPGDRSAGVDVPQRIPPADRDAPAPPAVDAVVVPRGWGEMVRGLEVRRSTGPTVW